MPLPSRRSIDAIIEEQVRRWQLTARRQSKSGVHVARPVVAISRQHGAGGVELGRKLAERLGFSFWHKEILHEIASSEEMPELLLASFDERRRSVIGELVGNLVPANRPQSDYVRALAKVLHAIATHGGAVIIGRGAQYLLAPGGLLRVQVIAPLERRVDRLVARGMTEAEARKEISAVDFERTEFVRQTFHRQIEDPLDYDLVLNLGGIELNRAVDVVLAAVRARFPDRL